MAAQYSAYQRRLPRRWLIALLSCVALSVAAALGAIFLIFDPPYGPTHIIYAVAIAAALGVPVLWLWVLRPVWRVAEHDRRRLDAIMETAADGIITINQGGTIEALNPMAEKIAGYTQEEVIGRHMGMLLPPPESSGYDEHIAHFLTHGRPKVVGGRFESTGRRKDGSLVPVEIAVSESRFEGTTFYTGIFRDITGRKAAERALRLAEEKFRALVEQSLVGICIVQDDRVQYANPTLARMLGYGEEELVQARVLELVAPEDRERVSENIRRRLSGEAKSLHYTFGALRRGGGRIEVEVHGTRTEYDGCSALISAVLDITERLQVERALKENERTLREINTVLGEGVYVLDPDQRIVFVNPAAEDLLGWSAAELLGEHAHEMFHYKRPDGTPFPAEECGAHKSLHSGEVHRNHEDYFIRKDGTGVPVAVVTAPILREGRVAGSVTAFHDITERLEAQRELRESEERYRMLFNSGRDAIFVHTLAEDGTPQCFIEVNDIACQQLGYSRRELLRMTPLDICYLEDLDQEEVQKQFVHQRHALVERIHVSRDGTRIPVEINAHLFEFRGRPTVVSVARDVTERKQAEARIKHLAHHDPLTSLPNRRLLNDRMHQALAQARRFQRSMALAFIDLDEFKGINDTLGHDVGDELLKVVATRLTNCVRAGDTVARMGGDEFVIILSEIARVEDARRVAHKVMESVALPIQVRGYKLHVTASIGISLYPADAADGETLMKHADVAMYRAKQMGKNGYAIYDTRKEETPSRGA
jgi:diguanylate cyclase (GGDEF)-like protein/PAS domain S-box-containing protein